MGQWVIIERNKFKCNKLIKELITNNVNPAPPPCQLKEQLTENNEPTIVITQGSDNLAQALKWQQKFARKRINRKSTKILNKNKRMNVERDTLAIAIATTEVLDSLRRNTSKTASSTRKTSQQVHKRSETTALDEELRKFMKTTKYEHDKGMDLAHKIDTAFNK